MNDTQLFQLFGLGFFAVGVGMLMNPIMIEHALEDLKRSVMLVYLSGLISLVAGFALVTFHNIWSYDWSVLITIIGWLGLIKGLSIIVFPRFSLLQTVKIAKNDAYFLVLIWLTIILGTISLYLGFVA